MKQYLLFDLDGTLTDSGPGIMHAAQTAFLCKADAVIADGLGVAGAVRDPAKILKEAEYGARLQLFQYAHRKNLLNM